MSKCAKERDNNVTWLTNIPVLKCYPHSTVYSSAPFRQILEKGQQSYVKEKTHFYFIEIQKEEKINHLWKHILILITYNIKKIKSFLYWCEIYSILSSFLHSQISTQRCSTRQGRIGEFLLIFLSFTERNLAHNKQETIVS